MSNKSALPCIKICGVTSIADAEAAVAAGATAIGINFFPGSKRFVTPPIAAEIVDALSSEIISYGVFVNASSSDVAQILASVPLRGVQLHGEESPQGLAETRRVLDGRDVFLAKALSTHKLSVQEIESYVLECGQCQALPDVLLLDAATGAAAGQGELADWDLAAAAVAWLRKTISQDSQSSHSEMQILLAGGLTPDNVAAAIETVQPDGVDVASGVETTPGSKDPQLVREFVLAAMRAFAALT